MRPLLALFVAITIPLGLYVYIGVIRPHYQPPPAPPKPAEQAADVFKVELTATFSVRSESSGPALLLEMREQEVRIEPPRIVAGQMLPVDLPKVHTGRNELIVSAHISNEQADRHHALHLRILRNGHPLKGGEKTFWLPPATAGQPLRATFPFKVSPADKESVDSHGH
jgi:hypothetical protein